MNVKLLKRVRRHILAEPKRLCMATGLMLKKGNVGNTGIKITKMPSCGTVACIAGWAVLLSQETRKWKVRKIARTLTEKNGREKNWTSLSYKAKTLLELTNTEAAELFEAGPFVSSWPYEWREKLEATYPGTRAYARVVAAYITHFIKTNGQP